MTEAFRDVLRFHLAADLPIGDPLPEWEKYACGALLIAADSLLNHSRYLKEVSEVPGIDPAQAHRLFRARLMLEELAETLNALGQSNEAEFADGLADLVYVVLGTAIGFGIPLPEVWREVQRANMSKMGPDGKAIKDAGGKVIKPKGWTPPGARKVLSGWRILNNAAGRSTKEGILASYDVDLEIVISPKGRGPLGSF